MTPPRNLVVEVAANDDKFIAKNRAVEPAMFYPSAVKAERSGIRSVFSVHAPTAALPDEVNGKARARRAGANARKRLKTTRYLRYRRKLGSFGLILSHRRSVRERNISHGKKKVHNSVAFPVFGIAILFRLYGRRERERECALVDFTCYVISRDQT